MEVCAAGGVAVLKREVAAGGCDGEYHGGRLCSLTPAGAHCQYLESKKMYVHRAETRIRYGETDRMGVVYHSNYLYYFELGRTEYMRSLGLTYRSLEDEGFILAVVEAHLRYRGYATYDDAIVIETFVSEVSRVRIRFDYRVVRKDTGEELCQGYTVLACVDREGKLQGLPVRVRGAIERANSA